MAQGLCPAHDPAPLHMEPRARSLWEEGFPLTLLPVTPAACQESCLTCSSPRSCTACQEGMQKNSHGTCVAPKECAAIEYWDEDTHRCKPCHRRCFHCTGPAEDQCRSCPRSSLLLSELLPTPHPETFVFLSFWKTTWCNAWYPVDTGFFFTLLGKFLNLKKNTRGRIAHRTSHMCLSPSALTVNLLPCPTCLPFTPPPPYTLHSVMCCL